MMKAAPTKKRHRRDRYFLSALATPNPTVAHFTIEHDGIVEELDGICCMAGNTSVIQNDINLFPNCRMNDGMVDIVVIEPVRTVQLLPTVITAALDPAGKVLGRPQFKIIQTKEAKITCTPSLGMQFDGEIISSNSGVFAPARYRNALISSSTNSRRSENRRTPVNDNPILGFIVIVLAMLVAMPLT